MKEKRSQNSKKKLENLETKEKKLNLEKKRSLNSKIKVRFSFPVTLIQERNGGEKIQLF